VSQGLGVPLFGVSTLEAIAWRLASEAADRGLTLVGVVGDAMRGEVYPALFRVSSAGVERLTADRVAGPEDAAREWRDTIAESLLLAGNGLAKHLPVFTDAVGDRATIADTDSWAPDGRGLLAAYGEALRQNRAGDGEPALVLPVYTRLSDAEEAERLRAGMPNVPPPHAGVLGDLTEPSREIAGAHVRRMTAEDLNAVCTIENASFSDAWSRGVFLEELVAPRRAWVVAEHGDEIIGYGGVAAFGDEAHLMNLAVREEVRGRGVGRVLFRRLTELAAELGPRLITLEVRESNRGAIEFYQSLGLEVTGVRPRYYSDTREDALIMWGSLPARGPTAPILCPDAVRRGNRRAEDTIILAIETSCDETAAAVIRGSDLLLANVVASQVDFHSRFGGVVPEIASRKHAEAIVGVVDEAIAQAGVALGCSGALPFSELDAIAVTYGPGLVGALVVGLAYAKGLSYATGVPLVGVNHLEGHIFANVMADPEIRPPLVALVVSGGHTSLVHMPEWGVYRTMGETLDDATGEAFDKVAKVLGLGYPGGPILSQLAAEGDPAAIDFPRAMMRSGDYQFSLSGLKTAVINHIRHEREAGREIDIPDLAASFQAAVIDVQVSKAVRAVKETEAACFCLAGGVAANPALREQLRAAIEPLGVHVSVPPLHLCTDNAAMIAAAAYRRYRAGDRLNLSSEAHPGLRLDTP
jgi:N6-L-threonylcarbamoyladenine synthase